jgi:hypothetical protein
MTHSEDILAAATGPLLENPADALPIPDDNSATDSDDDDTDNMICCEPAFTKPVAGATHGTWQKIKQIPTTLYVCLP